MSQQAKPGRRTPLSLGQPKGDVSDKTQMRTSKATVNLEKLSTELLSKQAKNGSNDEKTTDINKAENGQNNIPNNGSTTKKDGNGVHSDIPTDNSKTIETPKQSNDKAKIIDKVKDDKTTASPKVSEKPVEKAKPSIEKVAIINDKPKPANDNVSGISKIAEKVDAKNGDKEVREKEVRESVRQKQIREEKEKEESVKVVIPNNQPTKTTPSTPDKNAESSKVKEKRKPEVATPTKNTPKALPSESLLAEKSLKGFNENLEESESIRVSDSPMPAKDAKLLKLSQGPPTSVSRNKRSEKLEDASLVVNLSTVSELSNESTGNSTPVERSYSLRHITGRRSTRPLREISFDFRMRESYYKIPNEFSDSNTNETSSSESPRVDGQFKRSIDDDETASPKRSKYDFGLFDFVTSPVKKLGAKFSRTRLSTSTPNKLIVTEEIPSGIEAEHFVSDEDMATIELNPVDDVDEKKMEMDTDTIPADEEAPIEVHEPSKSRCVVM